MFRTVRGSCREDSNSVLLPNTKAVPNSDSCQMLRFGVLGVKQLVLVVVLVAVIVNDAIDDESKQNIDVTKEEREKNVDSPREDTRDRERKDFYFPLATMYVMGKVTEETEREKK